MSDNLKRKCHKCGISPRDNPNIQLSRFPKPGSTNIRRCEMWAKYCFPDRPWSSVTFQKKLHSEHRMLCHKHFKDSEFLNIKESKLSKHAIPDMIDFNKENEAQPMEKHSDISYNLQDLIDKESAADNIDNKVDDHISPLQLFSWQKDSEVICDDFNYNSDNTTVQKTTSEQDETVKQAEYNSIKEPYSTTGNTTNSNEMEDLHEGYKCDMCKGPIYRFRYTCVQCADYDLCGACEGRALHAGHYLLRVPRHKPYVEIQQVMDAIRRFLSADIKSFQTEANFASYFLDDIKSEVVSDVGADVISNDPDNPISENDWRHEDVVEKCGYSSPTPNRSIVATSHDLKTDEGMYEDKATSTPQTQIEHAENNDPDIDWLDEDILEEYGMTHQSNTTESISETDLNNQHKYFHRQFPARKKLKINNCPSNASGKVCKRMVYGAVSLPKVASSTDVVKMLKNKHS